MSAFIMICDEKVVNKIDTDIKVKVWWQYKDETKIKYDQVIKGFTHDQYSSTLHKLSIIKKPFPNFI